jgi:hypothetical protein
MVRSVRSLAAEAGLPVRECLHLLRTGGLKASAGAQHLDGNELVTARRVLGLPRHRTVVGPPDAAGRVLGEEELVVRLLRPLREKGKVSRNYTTAIELLHGHGVPDHQKDAAKGLVEALLKEGCLGEKVSQRRRHVWLTAEGQARLLRAEEAIEEKR